MSDGNLPRSEIIKVLVLCIIWYSISSGSNVIRKMVLNEFPYPVSVTMVHFLSIAVISGPVLTFMGVRGYSEISWKYYKVIIIPLALGKFLASVFSHVSLWKVPVSYAHTVKATMPLFTVILSRLCFGETQTFKVYASLVPIILGVAIATLTELSFDIIGLIAALSSTCGSSLQNIFSKKVLTDTGIHPLRLVHLLGRLALLMFTPVWLVFDGYRMLYDAHLVVGSSSFTTLSLLALDGFLNWLQNLVAFSILHKVVPLTYAVASTAKRISVVLVSLLVLRNPVTPLNLLGMLMAIIGVLAYNKAKYDANKALKRQSVLPVNYTGDSNAIQQLHPAYPYDYTKRVLSSADGSVNKSDLQSSMPLLNNTGNITVGQPAVDSPVNRYFVSGSGFDLVDSRDFVSIPKTASELDRNGSIGNTVSSNDVKQKLYVHESNAVSRTHTKPTNNKWLNGSANSNQNGYGPVSS